MELQLCIALIVQASKMVQAKHGPYLRAQNEPVLTHAFINNAPNRRIWSSTFLIKVYGEWNCGTTCSLIRPFVCNHTTNDNISAARLTFSFWRIHLRKIVNDFQYVTLSLSKSAYHNVSVGQCLQNKVYSEFRTVHWYFNVYKLFFS